ncbi:MAG: motif family protein [Ramlibacter sp.]|nr:motif family protein [Ramlibacter sp.]
MIESKTMMTASCRKAAFLFASGVLAVACSIPAHAQFGSGMGGGGGMGGGRRGTRSPEATAPKEAGPSQSISVPDALYEVRMRLLISQDEAAAWERFYQAYIAWTALAARPRTAADGGGALQSVQQQLSVAQNRFASTEDLAEALKALFASLTPPQQQMADDLVPRLLALTSPSGQRVMAR